jgi:hypothetical protein
MKAFDELKPGDYPAKKLLDEKSGRFGYISRLIGGGRINVTTVDHKLFIHAIY